jgi:hypothetical protein
VTNRQDGHDDTAQPSEVPEPQGYLGRVPFDLRRPTLQKVKQRWWNASDPRVLTPKAFGLGWDLNVYWVVHPAQYLHRRSTRP